MKANTNPEEINIGDSDEDESANVEGVYCLLPSQISCVYMPLPLPPPTLPTEVRLEQQTIPSAVFGSIPEETQGEVLEARQRLAMKKKA